MHKVLVNTPIHPEALRYLAEHVELLTPFGAPKSEVLNALADADALILSGVLSIGAVEMDLAPRLQVIGRHGVGLDTVDLAAATERRLPVVYTPYAPTESTAEHAFMLILATARRLPALDRATRSGNFGMRTDQRAMGIELKGKALGIAGFGRIGRRLAEMCHAALQMPIFVYDPYLTAQEIEQHGATPVSSLAELAGRVDVLSVHTPLTEDTHHLASREVISAMRPGAIFINASRGPVVDEAALIDALREGHIAGAGLDVYDPEPPESDNPLFALEQVVLTPHVGSFTDEARRLMGLTVAQDVLRVLRAEHPEYLANPQIWEDRRLG